MKHYIVKMNFTANVHFGKNSTNNSESYVCADTIYSALCVEAINKDEKGIERLNSYVMDGKFKISDAFPYIDNTLYIPKPDGFGDKYDVTNSIIKKSLKKLKYIPFDKLNGYITGVNFNLNKISEDISIIGDFQKSAKVKINYESDNDPYIVVGYRFKENSGLYFILECEDDIYDEVTELITEVSYAGIGGKRSSGYGRFDVSIEKMNKEFETMLNKEAKRYMTLSVSMAKNDELESVIENSTYTLVKRSGFIGDNSEFSKNIKKKNFFSFSSGSCFDKKFEGVIANVSPDKDKAVYRYAIPMFLGVK